VSFILDALRKSEHERQRSALPSLAHVPVAPAPAQMPRWAVFVMAGLAATVLALGGAWWQSSRAPRPSAPIATTTAPSIVERSLPLPAPAPAPVQGAPPTRPQPSVAASRSLADTAGSRASEPRPETAQSAPSAAPPPPPPAADTAAADAAALPSAASLVAQGVVLPPLRLELHGYAEQPSARFVFINGRKYGEGERLADGPDLVAVEPRGAVLSYAGRRFLLLPE
jgi:general secretion pathway protein B